MIGDLVRFLLRVARRSQRPQEPASPSYPEITIEQQPRSAYTGGGTTKPDWTVGGSTAPDAMVGRMTGSHYVDEEEQPIEHIEPLPIPDDELAPIVARAELEWLPEEGYFATVDGFPGAWAVGDTEEAARAELLSVLRSWISLGVYMGDPLPDMPSVNLSEYVHH